MPSTFLGFSTTAASNTDVNGTGIQGTSPVSNFDNALRETWAILRRDLDGRMVLSSKSAGYTAVANDNNAVIRFSAAATLSLTAAATLGSGWHCWVMADGGAVVIDPNASETINGATTITIPDGYSTLVICDGTNFRALEDYATISAALATKLDAVQASVDVASATTTDIGAVTSQNVRITGTTTITGLGTVAAGTFRRARFAGALTLTHNATSLILPGGANITTAAGDVFEFISEGSGNWRCVDYTPAAGAPIITPWVTYTPTFTGFGTVSTQRVRSRRVGGSLEVQFQFTTGTSTAVNCSMTLGFAGTNGGITVSSAWNSVRIVVGHVTTNTAIAAAYCALALGGDGFVNFGAQTSGGGGLNPITGSGGFGTGVIISGSITVPIEGWS